MINKKSLENIAKNKNILIREEDFAYLLPCEQLRSLISNFTITFPNNSMITDDYTIMPHGSVTLVLFSYCNELHSLLFGSTTKPVKVGNIANKCDVIFIVEFQPAGICPFIKLNHKELTDKIVPFSIIHSSLDTTLRNIFMTSLTVTDLLLEFEKTLLQSIQFQYPTELEHAIKTIIQMKGNISSDELTGTVFYCSRHLNRLFNSNLGMSIKSFTRLVRINNSIQLLNDSTNTLAFICEKLGYYDVSHFIKDFKIICGITPQEYKANMSDFYSEIAKY